SGRVLASNNGFDGSPDPLLACRFAADGSYSLRVGELLLGGSADHFYRLSIGAFSCVTGFFPLSVPSSKETEVELIGYNLPPVHALRVKAEKPGELELPIDAERVRSRRAFKVVVGSWPEAVESEPNDTPEQATKITPPCAVAGRIWHSPPREPRSSRREEADYSKSEIRNPKSEIDESLLT